jgi:hypothetical protein
MFQKAIDIITNMSMLSVGIVSSMAFHYPYCLGDLLIFLLFLFFFIII